MPVAKKTISGVIGTLLVTFVLGCGTGQQSGQQQQQQQPQQKGNTPSDTMPQDTLNNGQDTAAF